MTTTPWLAAAVLMLGAVAVEEGPLQGGPGMV